nr:hypothetical protein GCM10025730_19540 [Promicromonospora thailandica]
MTDTPVDLGPAATVRVATSVLAPLVAQGAIVRRPRATAWAERHQTDRTARAVLAGLRARHDGAPLALRLGPRRMVVVTQPDHVRRLLEGSPEPFTPATTEKVGALRHFQPDGVLISPTPDRAVRRPFNEAALRTELPVHDDGAAFTDAVRHGAGVLVRELHGSGGFDAQTFARVWWEVVLEIVFGAPARGDHELVDLLNTLRGHANWSVFHPRDDDLRQELARRLEYRTGAAEPGTLAAAARAAGAATAPGQVPHWLFAFDAAGAATLRALAVVAARPEVRARLLAESADPGPGTALLPYARACVLESLRLWPTTLVVLRDSTEPTVWGSAPCPPARGSRS